MSVSGLVSSKALMPFVRCYGEAGHKCALFDLIRSCCGRDAPEVSHSSVVLAVPLIHFTWLTALIISGVTVRLNFSRIHINVC